jgi:hypothetical protein
LYEALEGDVFCKFAEFIFSHYSDTI